MNIERDVYFKRSGGFGCTNILLKEVICLSKEAIYRDEVKRVMDQIRDKIGNNSLLSELEGASQEEINHLTKQYGGEYVEIGLEILETFNCLNRLVNRMNSRR